MNLYGWRDTKMKITKRQLRRIIREALGAVQEDKGSTKKYDDDSALKGDQDELPDGLQKGIIDKTVEDREEAEDKKKNEGTSPDDMPDAWRQILGNCL
jgi:hypothetical protein